MINLGGRQERISSLDITGTLVMLLPIIDLVLTYAIPDSHSRDITVATAGSVCLVFLSYLLGRRIYRGCMAREDEVMPSPTDNSPFVLTAGIAVAVTTTQVSDTDVEYVVDDEAV
jgi:hypothetical protein